MTIADRPQLPEPVDRPTLLKRLMTRVNPKKWLNHFAAKALQAADVVLGSIPAAEVAAEIKDVALIAITE